MMSMTIQLLHDSLLISRRNCKQLAFCILIPYFSCFIYIRLQVKCSNKFNSVGNIITVDDPRNKRNSVAEKLSDSSLFKSARPKRSSSSTEVTPSDPSKKTVTCNNLTIPLILIEPSVYSTNVLKF